MRIGFTGHPDSTIDSAYLVVLAQVYPAAIWVYAMPVTGFEVQVSEIAAAQHIQRWPQEIPYKDFPHETQHWAAPAALGRWIIRESAYLIAAYDGRTEGLTWSMVQRAENLHRPVYTIRPHVIATQRNLEAFRAWLNERST